MLLIIVSGLPGAGKSTYARRRIVETGAVLIGRDELRQALVNVDNEATMTEVMAGIARQLLLCGRSVLVDSWNLHPHDRRLWQDLALDTGSHLDWVHIDTPVEECVRRDAQRPTPNGAASVRSVAAEFANSLAELAA